MEHPKEYLFRKAYANVPISMRTTEIVCVVDDEPMTFNVIKLEVDGKTEIGYKAVQSLIDMEII